MSGSALLAAKRALREAMAARRSVDPARRDAIGRAVAEHVLAMPELARAEHVALYAALPDELPTEALFEELRRRGFAVLLPRCEGDALEFARVDDLGVLGHARHGVLEPSRDAAVVRPSSRDLMLVPGVAFDRAGGRLGRGMGFYDRTLARLESQPLLFGLAYAFQLVPAVPMAAHDRCMDGVVTERGVVRIGARDRVSEPG